MLNLPFPWERKGWPFVRRFAPAKLFASKAVDVRQLERELGVMFVLEGSVLRIGDRIRINAQLVDASTLWAERYDGTVEDVFALQDQVIQQIVSELAIELIGSGEVQDTQSETDDPQAYDAFLQGWAQLRRGGPDGRAAAIPFFERAIAIDPEYGRAYAALALTYRTAIEQKWVQRSEYGETNDKTKEYLARALERPTALAHRVSAQVHLGLGDVGTAASAASASTNLAIAAGSEITVPSHRILPLPSTTQIDVSLSDTSKPTYCSIAALLIGHHIESGPGQTSLEYGEQRPVSTGLYPIPELHHVAKL